MNQKRNVPFMSARPEEDVPAAQPVADPFMALIQQLIQGQQQQQQGGVDLTGLLREQRNDPVGDRNKQGNVPFSGPGNSGFLNPSTTTGMTPYEIAQSGGRNAGNMWGFDRLEGAPNMVEGLVVPPPPTGTAKKKPVPNLPAGSPGRGGFSFGGLY